jgi:hypothetical protein
MSRNYQASENPPKHWKPTARHLRDVASQRALDEETRHYHALTDLAPNARLALAEGIARFIRLNPTTDQERR